MKKYLTVEQVAETLQLTIGSVRNRISRGDPMPKSFRVGRRRLFPEDDFQEWMDSLTPASQPSLVEDKNLLIGRVE